jgi:uncharacterized membrane protein
MTALLATLQAYREDTEFMSKLAQVLAITAVVMLGITSHTMAYQMRRAHHEEVSAITATGATWASVVAACMRGHQFVWTDPHTQADMAAFCHVEMLGRLP